MSCFKMKVYFILPQFLFVYVLDMVKNGQWGKKYFTELCKA